MDGIREKFERNIKEYGAAGRKIRVAVSGGADSMCLLYLCLTSPQIKKEDITVVSIDHMIRGENSKRDLAFVADFCKAGGIKFRPFTVDVPKAARETGKSLETAARDIRRDIFFGLTKESAGDLSVYPCVLAAHHASDNVESILMHLFRGCGFTGLYGMHMEGAVFRPLLEVKKDAIDAYIKENGVPFVADETNADNRYTRNFIRSEIIPRIKEKYPGVEDAVLGLSEDAADADSIACGRINLDAFEEEYTGAMRIKTSYLTDTATDAFYVRRMLMPFGLYGHIGRVHINSVLALKDAKNGAGIDLPNGYRAVKEYEYITVYKPRDPAADSAETAFQTGETNFNGVCMTIAKEIAWAKEESLRFDLNKIPAFAVFRFRRDGDIFKPYGGGTKKLKEYLIDKKIPVRHRDRLVCVADGNEVLLIAGVEISDKIKTEENSDVYKIAEYYE